MGQRPMRMANANGPCGWCVWAPGDSWAWGSGGCVLDGCAWAVGPPYVAVATVSGCRAIVSWNFRHIVNFRRVPLYNAVNKAQGYGPIAIHTPPEVVFDDEEEEGF